jgi:hypothetical protein
MADTTINTGRFFCSAAANPADTRMRVALPTLVPPNFITSRFFNGIPFRL